MAGISPDLWMTLRRARLVRVLVVYLGASFVVLQIIEFFTENLGLPDWFVPGAVALLLIGLPVILTTAVVQSSASPQEPADRAALGLEPQMWSAEAAQKPSATEVAAVAKHWLTWRKAILGGVLAFALLGVTVTGWMVMRVLGIGPVGSLVAAGAIDAGERIILADFQSETGDTLLTPVATEAFRIDFAQSPLVNVAEPQYVGRVLERMGKESSAKLDPATAREVAIREGLKAVVEGEINSAGSGYVVSAQLVAADGSTTLAAYRETAADSTQVIAAIDKVSKKLREKIGESLKTIRANEPLQSVTTSSLEALRKYSQGIRAMDAGDGERGVALLREAVALDTAFAMAYRKLGLNEFNSSQRIDAMTKAYDHRDRLTDRERYLTIGTYHALVTDDRQAAINAYRSLLDSYPNHTIGINNLAVVYTRMRDFAGSEELYRRAAELEPSVATYWTNTISSQVNQGKHEAADSTLAALRAALPNHPSVLEMSIHLAASRRDYETAEAHIRELREAQKASIVYRGSTSYLLGALAELHGRLAEAEQHTREASALFGQVGVSGEALDEAMSVAWTDLWYRADTIGAVRRAEDALVASPLASLEPLDRPYLDLAEFFAYVGQPEKARAYITEWEANIDPVIRKRREPGLRFTLAAVARAEGRYEEAITEWRLWADAGACTTCPFWRVAEAYDRAAQADSAIAYWELWLETPTLYRLWSDAWGRAWAYERLGARYEARGETEKALLYYGRFVELWQDADPELQPRVDAARRAIQALSADR